MTQTFSNEQETDTDRLIAYQFQMLRERGEFIKGENHTDICAGCDFCWPESIERETDI